MAGTLERVGERYELSFERRLKHAPEKVWQVITEKSLLRQWFPCDVVGEWKVGAHLRFNFLHGEGDDLPEEDLRGEVTEMEPLELLEFRWGTHIIRCELTPDGDGCKLRFSESFPDASWGARNAAGWEMCFQNMDLVLQGAESTMFVFEDWRDRFNRYVDMFEPEMGPQQGPPENHPGVEGDEP